ncbi:MAG: FtsX-like permease family protein [Rickettsiales bacterium]|nr:FtsX-like permease family protein [Rickettsiales bacterium]
MTSFLTLLLGRLPIGWLQLIYNKGRFFTALAGVIFANILILMQLGFLSSLKKTTITAYSILNGDILISASNANTFSDGGHVPQQRAFQSLNVSGVEKSTPLYISKVDWKRKEGKTSTLLVIGFDPTSKALTLNKPRLIEKLKLLDNAFIDQKLRNFKPSYFYGIGNGKEKKIELNGRSIFLSGLISLGGSFEADGYLITSDETFWKVFPAITSSSPKHILIKIMPGANVKQVIKDLKTILPSSDTQIRRLKDAMKQDMRFQTTERPIGIVFGFGVLIGLLVGTAIVYQVLSSDVADHLKEYATFKAMGYKDSFFKAIIIEESVILACLGFLPGILTSTVLYRIFAHLTSLPMEMTFLRALAVLIGTIAICAISGFLATRKLNHADPAELF